MPRTIPKHGLLRRPSVPAPPSRFPVSEIPICAAQRPHLRTPSSSPACAPDHSPSTSPTLSESTKIRRCTSTGNGPISRSRNQSSVFRPGPRLSHLKPHGRHQLTAPLRQAALTLLQASCAPGSPYTLLSRDAHRAPAPDVTGRRALRINMLEMPTRSVLHHAACRAPSMEGQGDARSTSHMPN